MLSGLALNTKDCREFIVQQKFWIQNLRELMGNKEKYVEYIRVDFCSSTKYGYALWTNILLPPYILLLLHLPKDTRNKLLQMKTHKMFAMLHSARNN